ncbi:hypothetical protein CDD82_3903 [Ophiocordyceps australis]|uniref:Phosphatidylethanolamine-binding protein n=1 Tax=Ophiocordyceps australis TaxID=1399860 RepID=A0A2C5ZA25_9HYPO|nr:hypothetical protein CDD82_3903 [Ophiocordyceps australis]
MPFPMPRFRSVIPAARHLHPAPRFISSSSAWLSSAPASAISTPPPPPPPINPLDLDPNTVLPMHEAPLMRAGKFPVGSRRRRVAMRITAGIPFEQLPYQTFQEARKYLAADKLDKLARAKKQLLLIQRLEARDAKDVPGGERKKQLRLKDMRNEVARLKMLADVNDPLILKRFQDGLGDMSKPIYRYYAQKKWRQYDARLIQQRIDQFHIVPDILPKLDVSADVQMFYERAKIQPGAFINSAISVVPPRLKVQVFDAGQRYITVAVIDPDVPDVAHDCFRKRCHYLAVNIPLSPSTPSLPLAKYKSSKQLVVPWRPPHAQKGSPYHRLCIVLFEQVGLVSDLVSLRNRFKPPASRFSLRRLCDCIPMKAFGFNMFRTQWDDNMADVMRRLNIPGYDVELKPTHIASMKPPVKQRGWEAKRQGPKYRFLWKYTKRLRVDVSSSRRRAIRNNRR